MLVLSVTNYALKIWITQGYFIYSRGFDLQYEYLCEQDAKNPHFVNITIRHSWAYTPFPLKRTLFVDPLINGSTILLSSGKSTTNFLRLFFHIFLHRTTFNV
jgi:hypothetical protein